MLIKRYCVSHKAEANERILQELGPEALILTCTPSKNGKKVIVTAGIDQEEFARFRGPSTPFPADDLEEEKEDKEPKVVEEIIKQDVKTADLIKKDLIDNQSKQLKVDENKIVKKIEKPEKPKDPYADKKQATNRPV